MKLKLNGNAEGNMSYTTKHKIWIISDTHFFHKTMISENWREGFKTVEEMNETIISNWNKLVSPQDTIYHLGDVCIGSYSKYKKEIEPRLNGKIIYIKGNHDPKSLTMFRRLLIEYKGVFLELVHNPEDASGKIPFVIHGHEHKSGKHNLKLNKKLKYFNVNLEFNKMKPFLLSEVLGRIQKDL